MFRTFNQTKLFAPEMETGSDAGVDGGEAAPRIPLNETPANGPGSGRGKLRQELETSVAQERKGRDAVTAKEAKAPKRPVRARGPNHQEEPTEAVEEVVEGDGQIAGAEGAEGEAGDQGAVEQVETAPPQRLSKEAKEAWKDTPEPVKAAFLKFEDDVNKGVTALKQRYNDIDQTLAPRMEVIRKHGHTPAQAINQLFAWFEALQGTPEKAFPALAASFKFDLRKIPGLIAQQGQQAQQGQEQVQQGEKPAIDPAVQELLDGVVNNLRQEFGSQLGGLNASFQQQTMAKTQEILNTWSKGKPYFEEVRQHMAHLIGTGVVPALPDGSSDLDTAYDMAIHALKPVRERVFADQEKARQAAALAKKNAEKAAQQEAANKARRAGGGSLQPGSPGAPVAPGAKKGKGASVRESIMAAREEVSSR